jgi:hypothetical protein
MNPRLLFVVPWMALATCAPRSGPAAERLAAVPDSVWIDLKGPTLIGFYPIVTNAQIDADQDLATVLDDFSYHFGSASDSLAALGFTLTMRGGDTLWLRTTSDRWMVTRPRDSADVGYLLVDPERRQLVMYGVRTNLDLIESGMAFLRGRAVTPR